MTKCLIALFFGVALGHCRPALCQESDIHDAFFSALRSESGSYEGELKGDFAAQVHKMANKAAPVFVRIKTIRVFKQPGCKRLKAEITAPEISWVDTKTGAAQSFSYIFEMNLCPDGMPPETTEAKDYSVRGNKDHGSKPGSK